MFKLQDQTVEGEKQFLQAFYEHERYMQLTPDKVKCKNPQNQKIMYNFFVIVHYNTFDKTKCVSVSKPCQPNRAGLEKENIILFK